jgi:hypothetical protein
MLQEVNRLTRDFLWKGHQPQKDLQSVQRPVDQGGLGLISVEHQARVLQAKWFTRVLNLEESSWCEPARSLLAQRLTTVSRALSDLLTGDASRWHLKEASPIW